MGSKSSSSTTKNEFVTTTNQNVSGLGDGAQGFSGVGSVNIDTVDDIIVDRAFEFGDNAFNFGRNSLEFAGDGLTDILDFGAEIIYGQQDQLTNTLSSINAANATGAALTDRTQAETIQNVTKYVVIGVAVIGAIFILKKVSK